MRIKYHVCRCKRRPYTIEMEEIDGKRYEKCPICRGIIRGSRSYEQRIMKFLAKFFSIMALALSHAACIIITYAYRGLECGIKHEGFSAPASTAFVVGIPFGIGILIFGGMAVFFSIKTKRKGKI